MHVLAAVACFASLVHFCSAAAVEDEHFGFVLVVCLAAEVLWLGSELVLNSKELFASVAGSCWFGFAIVGNLEWHGP